MKCTIILGGFQRFDEGTKSNTPHELKMLPLEKEIYHKLDVSGGMVLFTLRIYI
jgi:hypothetical protein